MKFQKCLIFNLWVCVTDSPRWIVNVSTGCLAILSTFWFSSMINLSMDNFKCFPFLFLGGNNSSSLWASHPMQSTTVRNTINGYRYKDKIDKAHIVSWTLPCCHWFYLMSWSAKYLKVICTPYFPRNTFYIPSLWFDSLSRIIAANLREI